MSEKSAEISEKRIAEARHSLILYNVHLKRGHALKLKKKVYGKLVLTRCAERRMDEGI